MFGKAKPALAAALALLSAPAGAATLIDTTTNPSTGSVSLGEFEKDQDPLGQTFTLAEATDMVMAGGVLFDVNSFSAPTLDIIVSVHAGAGFGGAFLGSVASTLEDGYNTLHMVDFSFLGVLEPGEYTLGFSSGGTGRGALQTVGDSPGTVSYTENGIFADNVAKGFDFGILVTGEAASVAPVPLPAGLPLLAAGLCGLAAATRRQRPA